ncbi:MAG: colanic acid/amylovoran biosynthesis glycosyltransferase [Verrucomicrobiota bacterium]|jgi:glycosyltransferase involved in cell wall biosynthesis
MSPRKDDKPKPIVGVFRSAVFNASERFIQEQGAALTRWRPLVVGLERKGEVAPRLREGMIVTESAGERLAFRLRGRGGRIETQLRVARPALIHAHFATDGLLVLPLAQALGVPLITSLRGYDVTRTDGAMLRSGRLSWMRYALGKKRLQRDGALFLAVSDALRERAIARGYPEARTLTHYNGVDLDRFRPDVAAREPGLVLHVGRLVEKKGTKILIEAMAGVADATLVIIGEGPLRAALEREAREIGDRVRFLGALRSDEVANWMRRASVLAAPSVTAADGDAEGLPNVVVEAAASGLPVVGTNHSGIPEAIEDGVSGFLVPENDASMLAARLRDVLGSESHRSQMSLAARRLAERKFSGQLLTARLESIYDTVAGFDRQMLD